MLSAVRTAIGKYGGGLAAVPPCDLAATVVREAVTLVGVPSAEVGHAVFGNVIHTEVRDMYLSRVATVNGGLPVETPAFTVNRLCGSGLQAIVSAAQAIRLGDCDVAVAGGAESMSRGQYWVPGLRWGQRMGNGTVVDAMVGALTDPFDACHMGVTAENVAPTTACPGTSRTRSRSRATAAPPPPWKRVLRRADRPDRGTRQKGAHDRRRRRAHPARRHRSRPGPAQAGLRYGRHGHRGQRLRRQRRRGRRDPGRRILRRAERVPPDGQAHRLRPRRRRAAGDGHRAGTRGPQGPGAGRPRAGRHRPVRGERGIRRPGPGRGQGTRPAAGPHQPQRQRYLPRPSLGATGAILTVKALYELRRTGGQYALVTMCIGGGQGIAAVFERI